VGKNLSLSLKKRVWCEFHKANIQSRAAIFKPLITVSNAQKCNNGVRTIKPGHETTGNAHMIWSDDSSSMLFPASGRVYIWRTPKEAYNLQCLVPTVKHGKVL
jgi:hypothetical protein